HPTVGPNEFLSTEPAAPLPHLNFNLGLWFNYSRGSFALSNITCDTAGQNCKVSSSGGAAVKNLLGADLVFAIGLFDRLQIGIGLPMTLYQDSDGFLLAA